MGMVRRSFFKPSGDEGVFLHVYNHCVEGCEAGFHFSDLEKEKLVLLLKLYLVKYNIECISYCMMSNHYHLLLYTSPEKLTAEQMCRRYKQFTNGKKDLSEDNELIKRLCDHSNDISEFMREWQRAFTLWFNRTRDFRRKGTLWEQRFKCTKLVGENAVDNCLRYIELNPVRAGMCRNPKDYRFCSFGAWAGTGRHPFHRTVKKLFLPQVKLYLEGDRDMQSLQSYLRGWFARLEAKQSGLNREEAERHIKKAKSNPHLANNLLQKSRYWIDGVVLGSQLKVRENAAILYGDEKAKKRQIKQSYSDKCNSLFSLRWLQV
jgi:REP element-mobilizing transposase RayT